ncbi:MAG: AMIN domain-containing protein, partial [Candidatus Aminicenantes bacterium]|nr:AMIN domain-containing protein [Candidatus Aminicenantes bacterium]
MNKGIKTCFWVSLLFFSLLFPFASYPDSRIEIHEVRYHIHPSFTRVVIEIGKVRDYNFNQLHSPDRVYVDIYQVKLNPSLHGQSYLVQCDYLDQVRIAQKNPSTVRAVIDLDFSK